LPYLYIIYYVYYAALIRQFAYSKGEGYLWRARYEYFRDRFRTTDPVLWPTRCYK